VNCILKLSEETSGSGVGVDIRSFTLLTATRNQVGYCSYTEKNKSSPLPNAHPPVIRSGSLKHRAENEQPRNP